MKIRHVVTAEQFRKRMGLEGKIRLSHLVDRMEVFYLSKGYTTSSPLWAPAVHPRVFLPDDDSRTPLVDVAMKAGIVNRQEVIEILKKPETLMPASLTWLGIAAVPLNDEKLRLIGTSPEIAELVNHAYFGRKGRRLFARELISIYRNRKSRLTDCGLEEAISFIYERFALDLADVIGREFLWIGGKAAVWAA